jgi:hypothetical protein
MFWSTPVIVVTWSWSRGKAAAPSQLQVPSSARVSEMVALL